MAIQRAQAKQKIIPHLWFDNQAEEAAKFYTSAFKNSKIGNVSRYTEAGQEVHGQKPGSVMSLAFELDGYSFIALNGGPLFKINPSISFHIKCKTAAEVDALWKKLSKGGNVLMPLGKYPFSERYGWTQDKYGVNWQIIHAGDRPFKQRFTPVLMFVDKVWGKAEEAVKFYTAVFKNSKGEVLSRYNADEEPDKAGTVRYAHFTLEGQEFGAMDSGRKHNFGFNEAISLLVQCKDQSEIDYFWKKLSADPKSEVCGWLKDKYGVSWQIAPKNIAELISTPAAMEAMLKMKKLDIAALKAAK